MYGLIWIIDMHTCNNALFIHQSVVFLYLYVSFICLRVQNLTGSREQKSSTIENCIQCVYYTKTVCAFFFKLMLRFDRDVELEENRGRSYICLNWGWGPLWNLQSLTKFSRAWIKKKYSEIHQTLNNLDEIKYSSQLLFMIHQLQPLFIKLLFTSYFDTCL